MDTTIKALAKRLLCGDDMKWGWLEGRPGNGAAED